MAQFEFNGEEIKVVNLQGVATGLPEVLYGPNLSGINGGPSTPPSFDDIFNSTYDSLGSAARIESVPLSSISTDKRYPYVFRGTNPEEMYAQHQTSGDKIFNDVVKFAGLTATTIAGGFGMLYGAGKWALPGGKFSDVWNNEVMHGLDDINKGLEKELPNYYTQAEQEAKWWSTDNWLTTNFWFDKVIKNAGYAVGAMVSGNIANGIVGSAGSAIGRGLASRATALDIGQSFRNFSPFLNSAARAFSVGENVKAFNLLRSEISSISDLASKSTRLLQIEKEAAKYLGWNDAARRTAVALYSSAGESSFEALQTSIEYRDRMIDEYINTYGKEPEGEELEAINEKSREVGNASFSANLALLTATEFQQLPYLLGSSYKRSREAASQLLGKVDDVVLSEGKYISAAERNAGKLDKLKSIASGVGRYTFDPKEALQELGQYAIQIGVQNYYSLGRDSEEANGLIDQALNFGKTVYGIGENIIDYGLFGRDEEGEGVGALVSKEGIESAIIGGLTGGPMQAMGKYQERKAQKQNTQSFLKELNNAPTLKELVIDKKEAVNRAVSLQKKQQKAIVENDKLEALDAKADLLHTYLAPRIKYGKMDMVMQDIQDLEKSAIAGDLAILKDQGIGNINDDVNSFLERLSKVKETAKTIQEAYDYVNLNYAGEVIEIDGKRMQKYSKEALDKMVYAITKVADYDSRLPQVANQILNKGILVDDVTKEVLTEGKTDLLNKSIAEIQASDDLDKETSIEALLDSVDLALRRKKFVNEYEDIITAPDKYTDGIYNDTVDETEAPAEIKTIKVKTKTGERDIEVGTEYFLGTVIEYTKNGKEVLRAPVVKVLGENEDGTIKLQDVKTKEIINASPEKLEEYSLGKVSEADEDGKFIMDHWNVIYAHYGLKDEKGNPVTGKLSLSHPKSKKRAPKGTFFFNYVTEKGEVKTTLIRKNQLKAQGEFNRAMVRSVATLSVRQQKSLEDLLGTKDKIEVSEIEERNNFLSEMYKQGKERIDAIEKSISDKKQKLGEIADRIDEILKTKAGKERKRITSLMRKELDQLSALKTSLEKNIIEEESEKDELQNVLPLYEDMIKELSEYPEDNSSFIEKVKSDLQLLEDLINITDSSIAKSKEMLDHINELLSNSLSVFTDYLKRLKEENPKVPLFIDDLISNLEKFYGEEGVRLFIEQKQGITQQVLELESDINDFEEELEIPQLSKRAEKLAQDLRDLSEGIDSLINEQIAKRSILEKFEKFVEEREAMVKEEELLTNSKKAKKEALSTEDKNTVRTTRLNPNYEPIRKKPTSVLPASTVGIDRGLPHQTRAKVFAINLPKFEDVRGVYVTQKTEAILGLDDKEDGTRGVTDMLRMDAESGAINEDVKRDEVIALVMVNSKGQLLGVDGNPLSEEQLKDAVNHAVFQVKPDSELKMSEKFDNESMFRKGVSDDVRKGIIEKYTAERKAILAQTELGRLHTVGSSFGIPEYERDVDGKPDYNVRNSVESAALISPTTEKGNVSLQRQIIVVPTKDDIESEGLTTFTDASGRPFLKTGNGIVPLLNKKHSQQEAETIYKVLLQLSKYAIDSKQGLKGTNAKRLYNFLRGIVYWGKPVNDPGYNSIFFDVDRESGKLMLSISKEGYDVVFSPTELERNKGEIIDKISELYNNVNSSLLKKVNNKFEEITDINEKGEVVSVIWPNYQSYLISDRMPDANGKITTSSKQRKSDIPLTTVYRKVKGENDYNRHSLYFYTKDTVDDYAVEKFEKAKPKTLQAGKLTTKETEKQPAKTPAKKASKSFDLNGETVNPFTTAGGVNVEFIAPKTVNEENYEDEIQFFISKEEYGKVLDVAREKYPEALEDEEEFKKRFKKSIQADIYNAIKNSKKGPTFEEVVTVEDDDEDFEPSTFGQEGFVTVEEEEEEEAPVSTDTKTESLLDRIERHKRTIEDEDEPEYRLNLLKEIKGQVVENWDEVEAFLKKALPTIPIYRVKNVIDATNGRQAWGMFKNGAIYIYENAEAGTTYHEVFEAVWKMFTSASEQESIIKEFKSRTGTFVDRPSGNTIKYSEATPQQIKEQLAEEFRDYVQNKKIPQKPSKGKPFILKLFSDLVNFIKEFFLGKNAESNTEKLFKNITTGKYAKMIPFENQLSFVNKGIIDIDNVSDVVGAEFSLVSKLSDTNKADIVEEMLYTTMVDIFVSNKNIFSEIDLKRSTLLPKLKDNIEGTILNSLGVYAALDLKTKGQITDKEYNDFIKVRVEPIIASYQNEWDSIVKLFEERLLAYDIEFDENDNISLTDYEKSKNEGFGDVTKIDSFRKANRATKLLLSTIPKVNSEGKKVKSTIGGHILVPSGQVYITLLNRLSSANTLDEMITELREVAKEDPTYRTLYKRLTKQSYNTESSDAQVDLSTVKKTDELQLLNSFWKSFKKYNYAVKHLRILPTGEVVISDAPLSTIADQLRSNFINKIINDSKSGKGYFVYSDLMKAYMSKPIMVANLDLYDKSSLSKFLGNLGATLSVDQLTTLQTTDPAEYKKLVEAAKGVKKSIVSNKPIVKFTKRSLDFSKRLLEIAEVKARLENPNANSTHYNINGELTQSYLNPNTATRFSEVMSSISSLTPDQLSQYPQFNYLLTDSFVKGSVILQKMFDVENNKFTIEDNEEISMLLKVGYVGGTNNEVKSKSTSSGKLKYRDRLIQEINLNLKGWYYNLVPGDASLEHAIYLGNSVSNSELETGMEAVHSIFKQYFLSELEMSREEDRVVVDGINKKHLRFFKSILADKTQSSEAKINKLHNDIISEEDKTPEEVYKKYEKKINKAIDAFIENDSKELGRTLMKYNILASSGENQYSFNNIDIAKNLSKEELLLQMKALSVNYMIANIELHKLIYSDPYQYSDEIKRIKNFLSPRQALVGGQDSINDAFNEVWNEGYELDDIGHTNFKSEAFRTVTLSDVTSFVPNMKGYEEGHNETDGAGIISFKGYRHFRIRAGEWNDSEELQYRYDVAWEKRDKGLKLSPMEEQILKDGNPQVESAYTVLKPIVSGNKGDGNTFNDVVLDKFALYPLSYRIAKEINPTSNAVKLYDKMQNENIDYAVFESGRKVGALNPHSVYKNGEFNDDPFVQEGENRNIINIPFEIIGVQTEIPVKDSQKVTRGSQPTKLITMDLMSGGVPVDYELLNDDGTPINDFSTKYITWFKLTSEQKEEASPLYKEIKENEFLLKELTNRGYQSLISSLGIKETKDGYEISNREKLGKTLKREILKREVNDNIVTALNNFLDRDVILETTPAYQQIRSILYSIADREVISQKMTGGEKVQIPSTLLESVRGKVTKIKKGDKEIDAYSSDILNFYTDEDGKRVCEIMVGRWFDSALSDDELLDLWYEKDANGDRTSKLTEEGEKILSGLAYRVPTQKQNSIDAFVIKKFLPKEFRGAVVIPSALVNKVGSDFDIDKLTIYFKNVFTNSKGEIKIIELKGSEEETIDFYSKEFDNLNKSQQNYILRQLNKLQEEDIDLDREEEFIEKQEKLNLKKQDWLKDIYKQALQNAYVESSQRLVTSKENFKALIQPNSAAQLKKLSGKISKIKGIEFDYKDVGNMLSRKKMSEVRHSFVTGKYAIGIAAVAQTLHSLMQRVPVLINNGFIKNLAEEDRFWLDNGSIKFNQYNKVTIQGKSYPILSLAKNAERSEEFPDGQDISDLNGQFIDGYVDISKGDWIMKLGATPEVAGTWLFLIKLGVPIDTITYFMNQPIIDDYLEMINNSGYSYLFIDDYVTSTIQKYLGKEVNLKDEIARSRTFKIPSNSKLEKNINKPISKMGELDKKEQASILLEFLKYAKMSEQLLTVTQGINVDTAVINDPSLVFKKQVALQKSYNTIFSSPEPSETGMKMIPSSEAILKNSFLTSLYTNMDKFKNAFGDTVLFSDSKEVRGVLQKVLYPYINKSDRDFVKLSRKVVSDFFDWVVQANIGMDSKNKLIKNLLITDGGTAAKVGRFVNSIDAAHPLYGNAVIDVLEVLPSPSNKPNAVNNIKVKAIDNKAYDQNKMIYAFREIREYLASQGTQYKDLYKKIVETAIVQSGLSNSPISFGSILPYEDFQKEYDSVLASIKAKKELDVFYDLGVFQKNNWNDSDIVPSVIASYIPSINVYNPGMHYLMKNAKINKAVAEKSVAPLVSISILTQVSESDYITYSWEGTVTITPEEKKKGITPAKKKQQMRDAGDFSYINKGLFKKVKRTSGEPFVHSYTNQNGELKEYYIYQAVNAWGDSFRANEFYNEEKKSIIDNGMLQVKPASDEYVISLFSKGKPSLGERITTPSSPTREMPDAGTPSSGQSFDEFSNSYEPLSYSEDNFDVYDVMYPSEFEDKLLTSQDKNSPDGLPPIDRTNETC
jgi:hypothetical protein